MKKTYSGLHLLLLKTAGLIAGFTLLAYLPLRSQEQSSEFLERERILINDGWLFYKYASMGLADQLICDVHPDVNDMEDAKPTGAEPTEAEEVGQHYQKPAGNSGCDFPYIHQDFDDSSWELADLPHDGAIAGPFMEGRDAEVGERMGCQPSYGVAWYRRKLNISIADTSRSIFLDIDGAMSYAMVWLNGYLIRGWPYGYNSFRLDLTPYVNPGEENQLVIRLDNPPGSSRRYPGVGIYRNVWLVKTAPALSELKEVPTSLRSVTVTILTTTNE